MTQASVTDEMLSAAIRAYMSESIVYDFAAFSRMRSAIEAALSTQPKAVSVDAERYRKLRNAPLGVSGVPCIAIPKGDNSGDFVNYDEADAVVDGTVTALPIVDLVKAVVSSHETARNIRTDRSDEWEAGYAFAVDSICGELTAIIGEGD